MLFISDIQLYVPTKLCKTAGSIHLFKIKCTLKSGDVKLNNKYLWDKLEIDWNKVTVTCNNNKIELPKRVAIRIWYKIKVRRLMIREPLNFHMMIRQGITWFNLEAEIPEVYKSKFIFKDGLFTSTRMQFLAWVLQMLVLGRSGRCGGKNYFHAGDAYI